MDPEQWGRPTEDHGTIIEHEDGDELSMSGEEHPLVEKTAKTPPVVPVQSETTADDGLLVPNDLDSNLDSPNPDLHRATAPTLTVRTFEDDCPIPRPPTPMPFQPPKPPPAPTAKSIRTPDLGPALHEAIQGNPSQLLESITGLPKEPPDNFARKINPELLFKQEDPEAYANALIRVEMYRHCEKLEDVIPSMEQLIEQEVTMQQLKGWEVLGSGLKDAHHLPDMIEMGVVLLLPGIASTILKSMEIEMTPKEVEKLLRRKDVKDMLRSDYIAIAADLIPHYRHARGIPALVFKLIAVFAGLGTVKKLLAQVTKGSE